MATNSEQTVSGAMPSVEYAGFWARVAAYFLDYAILMIIFLVIGIGVSFAGGAASVIGAIAIFLISLLYFPAMESSARQATFGKSLAGIKVTDLDGKRLSFWRALLRTIAKILSAIPLSIGFLLAAFTKRKQALHDMLAKCLVVRTGPSHLLRTVAMAVGGLVIMAGSGGAYFYYVSLPQMQSEFAGMTQEAEKDASTAPVPPVAKVAPPAPTTPQVAKEPSSAPAVPAAPKSGSAGPDFDSLLGPPLIGFEKPGTTRAGPAILELSQFMGDSIWIKIHLPLIKDFDIAPSPEITVSSVVDTSGQNYYDDASPFETEFFRRTGIRHDSILVPHLSGLRTVRIKSGLSEQTLQKIEGQVHIAIPVDIKMAVFDASEAGKEKSVNGSAVELKSLSGAKAVLHYKNTSKSTSKKMSGGVRGYDKDGASVEIKMRQGSIMSGDTQIDFKGPVSKIEVLSATDVVERQFPFTLIRGAMAGSPLPVAEVAKPSALAPSATVSAADEPESIYAKFHSAGLTANLDEMNKYGTDAPDLASMPAAKRQEIQAMLGFLAQMLPKNYSVTSKTIEPDGNHATLHLNAPGTAGTATLVKEKGKWKVDDVNWVASKTSEPPSSAAAGGDMGAKAKPKSKPVMRAKKGESPAPSIAAADMAAPEPQQKVITPKFNDVFTAVMYRDLPAVRELLDLGWWADKPEPGGSTPLMAAVGIDDTAIAELLLKHGANPNASARGSSALRLAKHNHNAAMVALLQRYGATVE